MPSLISLTILCVALVAISVAAEMPDDKMKIIAECKDQEKATDEDVQALLSHKLPQTPTGKCLMACGYEKMGEIKDGKIDVAAMKTNMAKRFKDMGKEMPGDLIDQCQSLANPDRCELAYQLAECIHKGFATLHNTNEPKKN